MIRFKNVLNIIYLVVIGAALLFLVNRYMIPNNNYSIIASDTVVITKTKIDTVLVEILSYVPKVVYVDTSGNENIVIDTAAVIRSYFQNQVLFDTLVNDSNIFISVRDTLRMNRIVSRSPVIRYYPKTQTVTQITSNTITYKSHGVYAGITAGGNATNFNLGPALLYQPNNRLMFGVSYDIINKEVNVSVFIRPLKPP